MPRRPKNVTRALRWGSGSVVPRGAKWQARWQEGETRRAKTFDTQLEAEAHIRAIESGSWREPDELTVRELIAEVLAGSTGRRSPRTIRKYQDAAKTMINPHLGDVRVQELSRPDCKRWIRKLEPHFAPATIHVAVSVLSLCLREAVDLEIVSTNVATNLRPPAIERPRITVWSLVEAQRFLAHVDGDPLFGALYWTAIFTGMRPGELRALQWHNADCDRREIIVCATISRDLEGREYISPETKGHAVRRVAIPTVVAERLALHRIAQDERRLSAAAHWQDMELVFDRGDGHWFYISSWQRPHKRFCEEAGVPYITLHGLRHTSATLELAAGTHPKIVSDRLGHKDVSLTLNLYQHTTADLQREASDRLADRLLGKI